LSLFQPELFRITGTHNVHVQKRSLGDPEDPYDENYLRETSVSSLYFSSLIDVFDFGISKFDSIAFYFRDVE